MGLLVASLGETFVTKSYAKGKRKVSAKPRSKNTIIKVPKPTTKGRKTKPMPQTKPAKPNSRKPMPLRKPTKPTLSGFLGGLVPGKPSKSYRKKG